MRKENTDKYYANRNLCKGGGVETAELGELRVIKVVWSDKETLRVVKGSACWECRERKKGGGGCTRGKQRFIGGQREM